MTALAPVARWLAIAIALVAAVDPAITSMRSTRPEIAVIAVDPRDSTTAADIEQRLADDYTVIRGPYEAAAASIVVGDVLPEGAPSGVIFGVREPREIARLHADFPEDATTEARIPVVASWSTDKNTRGGRVELVADGVVVDAAESKPTNGFVTSFPLYVTPTGTGPLRLQVRVTTDNDSATVDGGVDVTDDRRPVLLFDRRPSWMSTFARRALERDRRFAVASRTITSKNISTDAGQPPSTLADPAVLELYDAIVVGAPTLLTAADVAGLETFLRKRGGAVVLLFDEKPDGGSYDRLTGAGGWASVALRAPVATTEDATAMRLSELAWPTRLPADAITRLSARAGTAERPVVWSTMVGRGELIVSGALDAWKFRDAATSRFDEFWEGTISRAAREATPEVEVKITPAILQPGEHARVVVTARDTNAVVQATVESAGGVRPLTLWPGGDGSYEGRIVGGSGGTVTVRATASGARAARSVVVASRVRRSMSDDRLAISTLAKVSGGEVTDLDGVAKAVSGKVMAERRMERGWPMRNGWWIVPFVGLLGVEWLTRRRRGQA